MQACIPATNIRRVLRWSPIALAMAAFAVAAAPAAPSTEHTDTNTPSTVAAQPAFDAARARRVALQLADLIEDFYVIPSTANRYAGALRANVAAGRYDTCKDDDDLGARVTADLQSVAVDRHLRLMTEAKLKKRMPPPVAGIPAPAIDTAAPEMPEGIEAMEMIGAKHDIAYLRFHQFSVDPAAADAARRFLVAHANARAVIIDGRPLRGGGLPPIDAMLPLFFDRTTTLARMETRVAAVERYPEDPVPTLVPNASTPDIERLDHVIRPDAHETRLRKVPLLYLTSRRTASAGEHLALALRSTHRGVLIGETTAGAGHFGGFETVSDGMTAFLPIGQTVDVRTGMGWEATGIAPDIAVPAEDALRVALTRLGEPKT